MAIFDPLPRYFLIGERPVRIGRDDAGAVSVFAWSFTTGTMERDGDVLPILRGVDPQDPPYLSAGIDVQEITREVFDATVARLQASRSPRELGRFLLTVEERDIDLLLMEEFHVSPEFVEWFCSRVGVTDAAFEGAWHSVSDHDGETDLLLRVKAGARRIEVLIENKVAAPAQPKQDARYHLRGTRSREAGACDDYLTCICAPSAYLEGLPAGSLYDHRISYEAIRDWYAAQPGPRSAWRCRIMDQAIEQGRRGYTLIENAAKSAFHQQYWEFTRRSFPALTVKRPKAKGSKSNWVYMKAPDMPPKVILCHKNDQGCVDLTFYGRRVQELLGLHAEWPEGISPQQCGKSAVLRVVVPTLDMERPLSEQEASLEDVLAAACRLIPYCRSLEQGSAAANPADALAGTSPVRESGSA
jgi:hypothetical protein